MMERANTKYKKHYHIDHDGDFLKLVFQLPVFSIYSQFGVADEKYSGSKLST